MTTTNQELAAALALANPDGNRNQRTLADLQQKYRQYGSLSDKQIKFALDLADKLRNRSHACNDCQSIRCHMSPPLLIGYLADRSPTGRATALLVTREGPGKPWTYLPDDGGLRRTIHGPYSLYGSPADAILAARHEWKCTQGKPRSAKPQPVDTAF